MIVFDIAAVLLIMLVYLIIPGIPVSFLVFKNASVAKRFMLSAIFGTVQFYIIYFILKNGVAELYMSTIALVFCLFIGSSLLLINNGCGRFRYKIRFV